LGRDFNLFIAPLAFFYSRRRSREFDDLPFLGREIGELDLLVLMQCRRADPPVADRPCYEPSNGTVVTSIVGTRMTETPYLLSAVL